MNKKYIIILIIVIVAAAGLYFYQDQKKAKDLSAHYEREYKRMMDVARRSPMAGLAHMGRALNKYKEKNGAYPARLTDLHPEFIPVKAFIDNIQWHYKPSGNSFHLSKTIKTDGDKLQTASIGPDLRLQKESDVATAAVKTPQKAVNAGKIKPSKKSAKPDVLLASTEKTKTTAKTIKPKIPLTELAKFSTKSGESAKPADRKKRHLRELEKVATYKLTPKEQFVHGIKSKQEILVWKNDDGSLGFSNIQYPRSKELTVYDKGEWVQIRRKSSYPRMRQGGR